MSPWLLIGLTAAGASAVFAVAWAWARAIDNYSPVDAVWAFGIGLAALAFAFAGDGDPWKRLAAGAMAAFWSVRLGSHLQRRIRRAHPEEDPRYAKLREGWEGHVPAAFFWFFQAQSLSVVLLALPFLAACLDASPWGVFETVGLGVALCGIGGEALADRQMSRFKAGKDDPRAVCDTGLWRYSRHPNYFFEAVIWVGFWLFACGSAFGWATFHAPVAIAFLLLKVTGIPPTEASALARKGDAYRDYQRRTSAFFPLPPRSS